MLRDLERAEPKPSNRIGQSFRWRVFHLALIVVMGLGSAKPNAAARAAAPTDDEIDNFDLTTSPIPNPACAHSHYDVEFFARVVRLAEVNGKRENLKGGLGPANVRVKATSSDPSIAEINPETATASGLDGLIAVSGAGFNLNTGAPGSATLSLIGIADWAGLHVRFPPIQQSIKVVNCKFGITITGVSAAFGDNMFITQVYTAKGEIGGDPSAALKGDADVSWHMAQVGDCYSSTITNPPSTAKLEGSLSEDGGTLTLRVTFDPLMVFNTVKAAGLCALSGATATSQGQLQPAPISLTVPSTGGTRSRSITLPDGALTLTGKAAITVVPLEAQ
jgi:hypothetical protein